MSGKVSECFVEDEQVCLIYGDPRFLPISFELFGAPIFAANVHALHHAHGVRNCIAFWHDICEKIVKLVPNLSNLVLLGDFNTKLGGIVSECIGSFASDTPNKVGKCVHEHLSKLKLAVPSTFPDCFTGTTSHTYSHHSGSKHRIDFIAVPLPSLAHSNVASTFEVPATHLGDHCAATLKTSIVIHNVKGSSPVKYDPQKFGDSFSAACFNTEISYASFFAPFLNNSSRLHYFNSYVQHSLIKWFPADCRSVRHSHISDCTRGLVKIRESFRHKIKEVKLLRLPNFVVLHHVSQFKKAATNAKRAAAIDLNTRLCGLCSDASSAIDKGDTREFYRIKRIICPKQSSPPAALHVDDKVLTCCSDIGGAFMKHFASALPGSEVDAVSSLEQFLCPDLVDILVEYPSFDISDTAKSGNLLSGAGTDTFKYIVYKHFPHLLEALRPVFHFAACNSPPLQSAMVHLYPAGIV